MLFGKDYTETDASVKFDLSLGGKYTDGVFVTAKFTWEYVDFRKWKFIL